MGCLNISYLLLVVANICYTGILAAPVSTSQLAARQIDTSLAIREFNLSAGTTEPFALQVRMYNEDLNARDTDTHTIELREHRLYSRSVVSSFLTEAEKGAVALKGALRSKHPDTSPTETKASAPKIVKAKPSALSKIADKFDKLHNFSIWRLMTKAQGDLYLAGFFGIFNTSSGYHILNHTLVNVSSSIL